MYLPHINFFIRVNQLPFFQRISGLNIAFATVSVGISSALRPNDLHTKRGLP